MSICRAKFLEIPLSVVGPEPCNFEFSIPPCNSWSRILLDQANVHRFFFSFTWNRFQLLIFSCGIDISITIFWTYGPWKLIMNIKQSAKYIGEKGWDNLKIWHLLLPWVDKRRCPRVTHKLLGCFAWVLILFLLFTSKGVRGANYLWYFGVESDVFKDNSMKTQRMFRSGWDVIRRNWQLSVARTEMPVLPLLKNVLVCCVLPASSSSRFDEFLSRY